MPWKGVTVSEQRERFLEDHLLNYYSVSELAERFTTSRKTAHKWIDRFQEHGHDGYHEESRRPHSCPSRHLRRTARLRWRAVPGGAVRTHLPSTAHLPSRQDTGTVWRAVPGCAGSGRCGAQRQGVQVSRSSRPLGGTDRPKDDTGMSDLARQG